MLNTTVAARAGTMDRSTASSQDENENGTLGSTAVRASRNAGVIRSGALVERTITIALVGRCPPTPWVSGKNIAGLGSSVTEPYFPSSTTPTTSHLTLAHKMKYFPTAEPLPNTLCAKVSFTMAT
jgi:hypothetical protein